MFHGMIYMYKFKGFWNTWKENWNGMRCSSIFHLQNNTIIILCMGLQACDPPEGPFWISQADVILTSCLLCNDKLKYYASSIKFSIKNNIQYANSFCISIIWNISIKFNASLIIVMSVYTSYRWGIVLPRTFGS